MDEDHDQRDGRSQRHELADAPADLFPSIPPPPRGDVNPTRPPVDAGSPTAESAPGRGVQVGGRTEVLFGSRPGRPASRRPGGERHHAWSIAVLVLALLACVLVLALSNDLGWLERAIRVAPIMVPPLGR